MGRFADYVLVLIFSAFLFIAIAMDGINVAVTGPITAESIKGLVWPPKWAAEGIVFWCNLADPILCENPFWLRVAAAYSPFLYAPFYLLAIYAFLFRKNWIRGPAIAWAAHLLNTLTLLSGEALYGALPSPNKTMFALAYGPYALVPLYVLIRMMAGEPFPRKTVVSSKKNN